MNRKKIIFYNLLSLFILYLNIILIFSTLYMFLDYYHIGQIVDHYSNSNHQEQWLDRFTRSVYFSAITLMSVGYGDITPFGWSKAIAIIEAMMGYILPTILVIKYLLLPAQTIQNISSTRSAVKQRGKSHEV